MIYRNIAWYDKQVLQPLKREPLTFLGRAIGAFVVAVGLVLACVYACAAIGAAASHAWALVEYNIAFWMKNGPALAEYAYTVGSAAVEGFLETTIWNGVIDFTYGQAITGIGIAETVISDKPLNTVWSIGSALFGVPFYISIPVSAVIGREDQDYDPF